MKRLILLTAALCVATSAAAAKGSAFSTTTKLVDLCEAVEVDRAGGALQNIKLTGCIGYLYGVIGAQHVAQLRGSKECDAFTYTGRGLVRTYLAKVSRLQATSKGRKTLHTLEKMPYVIAYRALETAYPCKME